MPWYAVAKGRTTGAFGASVDVERRDVGGDPLVLRWPALLRRIKRLRRRLNRLYAAGAPESERLRASRALDRLILVAMRRLQAGRPRPAGNGARSPRAERAVRQHQPVGATR